jgi:hypothetical protein
VESDLVQVPHRNRKEFWLPGRRGMERTVVLGAKVRRRNACPRGGAGMICPGRVPAAAVGDRRRALGSVHAAVEQDTAAREAAWLAASMITINAIQGSACRLV